MEHTEVVNDGFRLNAFQSTGMDRLKKKTRMRSKHSAWTNQSQNAAKGRSSKIVTVKDGSPGPREIVPEVMWDEGILGGYRPLHQPWSYYLRSMFWIHNETLNIWTHLLAPIFLIALLCTCSQDEEVVNNPSMHGIYIFTVAFSLTYLLSALMHVFYHKSVFAFLVLNQLDHVGIAIGLHGGILMRFYCSGNVLLYESIGSYLLLLPPICTFIMAVSPALHDYELNDKKRRNGNRRILCFIIISCIFVVLLSRLYDYYINGTRLYHLNIYHGFEFITYVTGSIIFHYHIPESLSPGRFDILGQGHQLFHVITAAQGTCILYASYLDLKMIPNEVHSLAEPNVTFMWGSFLISNIVNVILCLVCGRKYARRLQVNGKGCSHP